MRDADAPLVESHTEVWEEVYLFEGGDSVRRLKLSQARQSDKRELPAINDVLGQFRGAEAFEGVAQGALVCLGNLQV